MKNPSLKRERIKQHLSKVAMSICLVALLSPTSALAVDTDHYKKTKELLLATLNLATGKPGRVLSIALAFREAIFTRKPSFGVITFLLLTTLKE